MAYNPTKYKKPSKINSVSISMAIFALILGYLGYCAYPNFILASNVKEEMRGNLLELYRLNLNSDKRGIEKFKKKMYDKAREMGVNDKDMEINLTHNKEIVAIEVRFSTILHFEYIEKTTVLHHSPSVETPAERVDW